MTISVRPVKTYNGPNASVAAPSAPVAGVAIVVMADRHSIPAPAAPAALVALAAAVVPGAPPPAEDPLGGLPVVAVVGGARLDCAG